MIKLTDQEQAIFNHYKARYKKFNRNGQRMTILSYSFDDYMTPIHFDDVTALSEKTKHITYEPPANRNMYDAGRHIIEPTISD